MFNLGSKITITRGAKGGRPDFYKATIVSQPELQTINGRLSRIADVVLARETRAGELILEGPTPHNLYFAFPNRSELIDLLDGPSGAPLTVNELVERVVASTMEFLSNRPAAVSAMDLSEVDA